MNYTAYICSLGLGPVPLEIQSILLISLHRQGRENVYALLFDCNASTSLYTDDTKLIGNKLCSLFEKLSI